MAYTNNKLQRLGLLQYSKERPPFEYHYTGGTDYYSRKSNDQEEVWNLDKFELSNFGVRFIDFFANE
jgi:hypothetical protein